MKLQLKASPLRNVCLVFLMSIAVTGLTILDASAEEKKQEAGGQGDMGEIGKKLANPLADLWALNFNTFAPAFFDGDINQGNSKLGATTIFQPILPIPLSGEGKDEFRVIARPVVPLVWSQPIPEGFDKFDHKSGLGDIQLPLVFAVPASKAGNWILGDGSDRRFCWQNI